MKYVGVDLHKQSIKLCVVVVVRGRRQVVCRRSFACVDTAGIREFFAGLGGFQVVVEATAAYEWFFLLIEDLADRVVLAHPKKLRVIAESTRKTDKIDAEVLAVFLALFVGQLVEADRRLLGFVDTAPLAEREARAILGSIPQVGPVTIDVVLSELGDWRRFRSQKAVAAFAGLDPGVRQSADKHLDLHISKEGSRLLRWAMIQAAWRLAVRSPRWGRMFDRLGRNTGSKKKAIVGVARHLLGVMLAMLQSGQTYQLLTPQSPSVAERPASARARQEGAKRKAQNKQHSPA